MVAAPPGASATVTVTVPVSMRTAPFNVTRSLIVPPGFSASVYARVPGARFMAVAPNGDLLVSNPGAGTVYMVRARAGANPTVTPWASGLYKPHDIVFHTIGTQTYVYVAEGDKIARYSYTTGDSTGKSRQVVISGLPSASSPELGGSYGHELKNIALQGSNLYVSIASVSNASPSDVTAVPPRAAIHLYPAGGGSGRPFARGIRNAEGLAFVPGTSTLWAVVNNRDNIAYPFHNDFTGDGTDDYGKVLPTYVDNHPPEEFTSVVDGGNYGWPYCNPNPDTGSGLVDMPFDRDVENNADGSRLDCAIATRIDRGIQAHSAPLGLTFFQGTAAPLSYREGVAVAFHGSWNRTQRTGYKVAYFPWDAATGRPGDQIDLYTGWVSGTEVWGRPVDIAVDPSGAILVSDDQSGTIYRFAYSDAPPPPPPPTAPQVTSFTLINADTDQPIPGYDPLPNGATLNLTRLPTRNLNIRANTSPSATGSVRFAYDATANFHTDNGAPYSLVGDPANPAAIPAWTPTSGTHTVRATAFTGADATGTAGNTLSITINVSLKKNGR
jgi:glucose/arabinose dehydrogenase